MEKIDSSLTKHSIVLVSAKRDRGRSIGNFLIKMGYEVTVTENLYDAFHIISQEMPHLIITESALPDGNAGVLFDRLQQHEILHLTPILVHVLKKTRAELEVVAKRKFAGFFLGNLTAKILFGKVEEIMKSHSQVSPYFINTESKSFNSELGISIKSKVVGQCQDKVVTESEVELDTQAKLICAPIEEKYRPVIFRHPSNMKIESKLYNLFPKSRMIGKGLLWVNLLPEISLGIKSEANEFKKNRVVYFDYNKSRFQQFKEIMDGYNIELIYSSSLQQSLSMMRKGYEDLGCLYLHELKNDASGIEWRKEFLNTPDNKKIPVIIGTDSLKFRSTSDIRYIKRPFGIGVYAEFLHAACLKAETVQKSLGKLGYTGISCSFKAPTKVIGLDESGGILEVNFPMLKGCKVNIDHQFFQEFWGDQAIFEVTATKKKEGMPGIWQVRFNAIEKGSSKAKYWLKIADALKQVESLEKVS